MNEQQKAVCAQAMATVRRGWRMTCQDGGAYEPAT